MSRSLLLGAVVAAALGGCGSSVIEAPVGAHPSNDAVSVPFPPPPAKLEELPPRPSSRCVWVDGFWDFSERWEWQPGEWVVPPPSCRLAPMEHLPNFLQVRARHPAL